MTWLAKRLVSSSITIHLQSERLVYMGTVAIMRNLMKISTRLVLLSVTLLTATLSAASDISTWSNKTICRLLTQTTNSNDSAYAEEARTRGLVCGANLPSNKGVKVKSSVVLTDKPVSNGDELYKQYRSTFSSKLPECKGNNKLYQLFSVPFASWDNCWGEVSFKMFTKIPKERQGDQYIGEWQSGRFHGTGAYLYKGETFRKNNLYIGDFAFDDPWGKGEYYIFNSKNKEKYIGEVRVGLMKGYGKLYLTNGDVFDGYFINNDFKRGSHIKSDGSKYTGKWLLGKKNGDFEITDPQGNKSSAYYEEGIVVDLAQRAMDKLLEQELIASKEAEEEKKAQAKDAALKVEINKLEGANLKNLLTRHNFTRSRLFL